MVVGIVYAAAGVDDHTGGEVDGGHAVLDEEFEMRIVADHEDAHGFADRNLQWVEVAYRGGGCVINHDAPL